MKNNKTRKILPKLSKEEQKQICGNYANTYQPIEKITNEKMDQKKYDDLEKQTVKELRKAIAPSDVKAVDDFYSYINYKWLQEDQLSENQKYIVQVDDFRLLQDKVYRELLEIVKEYTAHPKTKKQRVIKDFYQSMLTNVSLKQVRDFSKQLVNFIDDFRKEGKNLWLLLGYINTNEIISWGSPFTWSLNPDDKEPTIFRCYINPPQVTLLDINVYFEDGTDVEYKKKYKQHYLKYIREMFALVFGPHHGYRAEDVFDVEVKMLYAMGCESGIKEDPNGYNKVFTKDAVSKYQFDWPEFASALGFKETPDFFVTGSLNYLKCGTELLLKEWTSEPWKAYWIYLYIRQLIRYNDQGHFIHYDFRAIFERGLDKENRDYTLNESIYPIFGLGFAFNTFLTNEYYDRYENKQYISYVRNLAEDLKTVFTRIIERNTWLQPKTKKYALLKFKHFQFIIGKPKDLREDPLLQYNKDECWGNLLKCSYWRHRHAVHLEGKPVIDIPVIDWSQTPLKFIGTQAYVVNACYTPAKNSIYIPLGYIQKPFVDLDERGIEYNLAYIGYTLGHEMSHSLDDWGSKYDYEGKLNDWWTPEDKKHFKKIQKDVIKQYEVFASYDGIKFDAAMSIGEDLADISGLAICLEYLRDFQLKNKDILPIRSLSYNAFFVYFAYQYRQQVNKKAIAAQLKTNPHPLDKYRTNVPLSRSPIFRGNYNIQKGDKMYWPSTNRVWED
jgi:predicted metalloendopeptidase